MKKFFITLLILLALGGTAFMFGWAQFSVPPGQYGVINSKTHGVDPDLVQSGEFRWVWYKLIPTNVKIAVFKPEHTSFPINFGSSLPSGMTYASFAGLSNADFSWDIKGEINFNIDPKRLPSLTEAYNLAGQDDLDAHLQTVAQNIESMLLRSLSSARNDSDRLERIMSGSPDIEIEMEILSFFPEIRNFSFVIHSAKYPDFVLYRQIRLLYEEFLSSQREYVSSSLARMAETNIETQLRFNELEKYGDLLTRYPVLLEYMTIERDGNVNR
ncbi:MAG: hypothetical protein LBI28_01080 [Treponema sp.]|jgi:hypothetical protein|nr:hypothetical protein [Treponema sp.]